MILTRPEFQTKPRIYRQGGIWHCKFIFDGIGFNPTHAYEQWKRHEKYHQDARPIGYAVRFKEILNGYFAR